MRSILARLRANRSKIYDGLSIDQSIARAEEEDRPLLSAFTQERYLATLREILDLTAKKRLIAVNPAEGMRSLKRETVAPSARRRSFIPEQLKQFFESEFYRARAQHPSPYKFDKRGWRFWLSPYHRSAGRRATMTDSAGIPLAGTPVRFAHQI